MGFMRIGESDGKSGNTRGCTTKHGDRGDMETELDVVRMEDVVGVVRQLVRYSGDGDVHPALEDAAADDPDGIVRVGGGRIGGGGFDRRSHCEG